MVLAGRGWLVSTSRAACGAPGLYVRLLFLSGIVTVAWLAGGIGVAYGDTASEASGLADRVRGIGDTAERTGQAASESVRDTALSGTAAHATSTTETLTGTVVPQTASLPANALNETSAASALHETAAGAATTRVVDDTARGAGGLVTGIARTSQDVVETTDDSLRDTGLVDTVADGLTDSSRVVRDGVDATVHTAVPVELPVIGATDELTTNPAGPTAERGARDRERDTEPGSVPVGAGGIMTGSAWDAGSEETAERATAAADEDAGERIRLIGGGARHSNGTDATGATAPSFPAPGAAGFLMARATHMVPQAQRVALPGDPTLVVRDAADDPSFSPD